MQLADIAGAVKTACQFGRCRHARRHGGAHVCHLLRADIVIPGRFHIEPGAEYRSGDGELGSLEIGPRQARAGRQDQQVHQRHRQTQRQLAAGTAQCVEVPDGEARIGDLHCLHNVGARQTEPGIFLLQPRASQHGDAHRTLGGHRLGEPLRHQGPIRAAAILFPAQFRRAARGQQTVDLRWIEARLHRRTTRQQHGDPHEAHDPGSMLQHSPFNTGVAFPDVRCCDHHE